jgi:hypothetical protein
MVPAQPAAANVRRKPLNGKVGDRFGVLNAFVDVSMRKLNRGEIAVWLVLFRDTRDGIAQTSQADIARRCGISDRTVRRAIERLVKHGLLTLAYQGGPNRGASKYRVLGTPPPD